MEIASTGTHMYMYVLLFVPKIYYFTSVRNVSFFFNFIMLFMLLYRTQIEQFWRMIPVLIYMCNIFKNVCWAYLWMWFRCTCIVLDFECTFILQNYRSKEEQEKIDVFLGTKGHPCYWTPCSYSSHHSQEAHGIIILQNKTENTCLSYEGIDLWFLSIRIINSIC